MMVLFIIIFSGIIYMAKSKYDIIFIKSCQFYWVSIYGTLTTVAYFDHNRECILEIIGRITVCELVLYVYFGTSTKYFFFLLLY